MILNPAPILGRLPADWLGAIDYLIPNEVEAEFLSGIAVTWVRKAPQGGRPAYCARPARPTCW